MADPAMDRHALWITRFDWEDEDDLVALVSLALKVGFTDLLMQARGAGDALYRSDVAPASAKIAGRLGGEAEWDPLGLVCELAGRADVRVHAWVNALSGWPSASEEVCAALAPSERGQPDHLMIRHPDAVLVDADGEPMPCPNPTEYVWVSARHEAVVAELEAVAAELTEGYPLAGVHLDRIRYPEAEWLDPVDRRRDPDGITRLVEAIGATLPDGVELSASIMPDYTREWDGAPEHLSLYGQDGWRWVTEGIADTVMPMVYTTIRAGEPWSWDRLARQHIDALPPGTCWAALYAEHDEAMLVRQAETVRDAPIAGFAWYSAGLVRRYDRWGALARVREAVAGG